MLSLLRSSLFILVFIGMAAMAMPDDHKKTLALTANTADINQANHRGKYLGQVKLDQGTTHLRATKAITRTNQGNKLLVAIAYGDETHQAHYWTQVAVEKPLFHAYADIIRYYPNKHIIFLLGHARITQGDNSFSAASIRYHTLKQHVFSTSQGKTRTTIIFHPASKAADLKEGKIIS